MRGCKRVQAGERGGLACGPSAGASRTSIIRHVLSACFGSVQTGERKREIRLRRGGHPSRGPGCGWPRAYRQPGITA
eukprot:scaffold24853_cov63-Phaeocystis_antarctica.AAC.1